MSIHGPAFGSRSPAEAPTINSGTPMPSPVAYSAAAPRITCRDWLITDSAAMIAGATHAVTTSADSAPMTKVPMYVPDFWRLLASLSRVCSALGSCSV